MKSYKLKDGNYIDSNSISVNKTPLKFEKIPNSAFSFDQGIDGGILDNNSFKFGNIVHLEIRTIVLNINNTNWNAILKVRDDLKPKHEVYPNMLFPYSPGIIDSVYLSAEGLIGVRVNKVINQNLLINITYTTD